MTANTVNPKKIKAIGIGAAGSIDKNKGKIITSLNINSLKNFRIADEIEKWLGIKVYIENDATAAVSGEWWHGYWKKYSNLILLTLGTGIGGGAVINNQLYTGQKGSAMEFAHISIDYKGEKCPRGSRGCFERYGSATSAIKFTREKLNSFPKSSIHKRLKDEKLTSKLIFKEAIKNDKLTLKVFNEISFYIGIGIANLINIFNPEAVIIGGGLSMAHRIIMPRIKDTINSRALKGLKENVKYHIIKKNNLTIPLGAAKIAINAEMKSG